MPKLKRTEEEKKAREGVEFIESLDRGLRVLQSFGIDRRPMTLSDIAKSGLVRPGALVRYKIYFKFDDKTDVDALVKRFKPQLDKDRIEPETVDNWAAVPAYRQALEKTLGPEALPRIKADADANMRNLTDNAKKLYRNFRRSLS